MSARKMAKKSIAILVVFCLIAAMAPVSVFGQEVNDISNHWAKDTITSWVNQGLINGYKDGSFKPDNNISRAEFISLVNGAFNYSASASIGFSDVKGDAWYASDIAKATAAGYISGYTDNTIKPNNPISRAEAAAIIMKAASLQSNQNSTAVFSDSASLGWSKDAVNAVYNAKIMNGYPDGSFRPQELIKRAEAVVALDKALNYSKNNISYNKAGTYGPETGTLEVAGSVTIAEKGITLQNLNIKGDLIITKNVGDGNVTLKNVTVTGKTKIYGGGQNSIIVIDSTLGTVTVSKEDGKIRIVISGNTTVKEVLANSGVKLEEKDLTSGAKGFQEVVLDASDDDVIILVGTFEKVDVKAEGLKIQVPKGTTVDNLVLDKKADFTGPGIITNARVNVGGVTFETAPKTMDVATGASQPVIGSQAPATGGGSGGGGGGGGSDPDASIGNINDITIISGTTTSIAITTDPDDAVVNVVSSEPDSVAVSATGHTIYITGTAIGTSVITVTASKSGYISASKSFNVTVDDWSAWGVGISETVIVQGRAPAGGIKFDFVEVTNKYGAKIAAADTTLSGNVDFWARKADEQDWHDIDSIYLNIDDTKDVVTLSDTYLNSLSTGSYEIDIAYGEKSKEITNWVGLYSPFVFTVAASELEANEMLVSEAMTNASDAEYTMTQADAADESAVKAEIENIISGLKSDSVTATVTKVLYTPAIAGTEGDRDGTDGTYTFTVTFSKGAGETLVTDTTDTLTMVITANAYEPVPAGEVPAVSNIRYVIEDPIGSVFLKIDEPLNTDHITGYSLEFAGDDDSGSWSMEKGNTDIDMVYDIAKYFRTEGSITYTTATVTSIAADGYTNKSVSAEVPFTATIAGDTVGVTASVKGRTITITPDTIDPAAVYLFMVSRKAPNESSEGLSDNFGMLASGSQVKSDLKFIYNLDDTDFPDISTLANNLVARAWKVTNITTGGFTITKADIAGKVVSAEAENPSGGSGGSSGSSGSSGGGGEMMP